MTKTRFVIAIIVLVLLVGALIGGGWTWCRGPLHAKSHAKVVQNYVGPSTYWGS